MNEETVPPAYAQNLKDRLAIRRIANDLRGFLISRGIAEDDPEAVSLIKDIKALERVAGWIGNRIVT